MTDTFDWAGLVLGMPSGKMFYNPDAAAYLRTRIEAAFVPVERYIERNRMWTEQVLATNEATARAETAEAENVRLRKALRDIDRKNDNPACYNSDINAIIVAAIGGEHDK